MVTLERLKEVLEYNPTTGIFTWISTIGYKIKPGQVAGNESENYIRIAIDGKKYRAHRLAWFYSYGCWPKRLIDHRNGNTTDNRLDNLREATRTQNNQNRTINKNSKTGIKGVISYGTTGLYKARIQVDKVEHCLGIFADKYEAEKVVMKYRENMHKEFFNHGVA